MQADKKENPAELKKCTEALARLRTTFVDSDFCPYTRCKACDAAMFNMCVPFPARIVDVHIDLVSEWARTCKDEIAVLDASFAEMGLVDRAAAWLKRRALIARLNSLQLLLSELRQPVISTNVVLALIRKYMTDAGYPGGRRRDDVYDMWNCWLVLDICIRDLVFLWCTDPAKMHCEEYQHVLKSVVQRGVGGHLMDRVYDLVKHDRWPEPARTFMPYKDLIIN